VSPSPPTHQSWLSVLTAPEAELPVLFVEVANGTGPPAKVADKVARYRRFFQRTVKDQGGQQVPLWSTLWQASGREGFPPVAFVFTKQVGPKAEATECGGHAGGGGRGPTDLCPTLFAGLYGGPGLHPDQDRAAAARR
jgi:hypothetical protein